MANDHATRQTEVVSDDRRPAPASLSDRVRSLRLKEKTAPARSRIAWLPWTLCALFAAAAGALGYLAYARSDSQRSSESAAAQETNKTSELNKTDYQTASSGEMVLERKGYVIPAHLILVSPKVSGMIVQLGDGKRVLEEGMRVQKDEVLAVVESVNYQADYDHCKAVANSAWQKFIELYTGNREQEIRQARGALDEMVANRKQLYLDWQRNSRLRGAAVAERDLELAESQYKAMD
ncbi:MAG TPA: hypothetical protein VKI17_07710, partial [Gemmataceae bacterium]|nr:hypothetical protein [Gemmataceae bacterium]